MEDHLGGPVHGATALVGAGGAVHVFERGASGWYRVGELAPLSFGSGGSLALDGETAVVATAEALCFFERSGLGWRPVGRVDGAAIARFGPPPGPW